MSSITIATTGSRQLSAGYRPIISETLQTIAPRHVHVGCAPGADSHVKTLCVQLGIPYTLHRASKQPAYLSYTARLVRRSMAMVHLLSAARRPLFVGFLSSPCPPGVIPRPYFFGSGSGTWGTLAFAAWHSLPLFVVICAPSLALPPWGTWQPVPIGASHGYRLQPPGIQARLC